MSIDFPAIVDLPMSKKAKKYHKNCKHTREARGNKFIYIPPENCIAQYEHAGEVGYMFNDIILNTRQNYRKKNNE